MLTLSNAKDSDVNNRIARERYDVIAAPMITTLKDLSGANVEAERVADLVEQEQEAQLGQGLSLLGARLRERLGVLQAPALRPRTDR